MSRSIENPFLRRQNRKCRSRKILRLRELESPRSIRRRSIGLRFDISKFSSVRYSPCVPIRRNRNTSNASTVRRSYYPNDFSDCQSLNDKTIQIARDPRSKTLRRKSKERHRGPARSMLFISLAAFFNLDPTRSSFLINVC